VGRCIEDNWECRGQKYEQVKCKPLLNNTLSIYNACICNYGFQGGWEYPCSCLAGRRSVWSNIHNGEVCLSTTECTANWHCTSQNCAIASGEQVGVCVNSSL
jgi:hypothetical protein